MSAKLIVFDSQYTLQQVKNIERSRALVQEAISILKRASAHTGWKCPEAKDITDNMDKMRSYLDKVNNVMSETAEVMNRAAKRFAELESRAEIQEGGLSSTLKDKIITSMPRIPAGIITLIPPFFFPTPHHHVPPHWPPFIPRLWDIFNNKKDDDNTTTTTTTTTTLQPSNFTSAMEVVFKHEGGYVNDPNDPGGETNMGITKSTLDRAYNQGIVSHNSSRDLTQEEAAEIYRKFYWEPSNADKMPEPLATIYFDTVVLCGQGRGGILLQRALNNMGQSVIVDGAVGPQTLESLNAQLQTPEDVANFCNMFCDLRQEFHNSDVNAKYYLAGWTNRVNELREMV